MINSIIKTHTMLILPLIIASFLFPGCSKQNDELGIGPVKEVKLGPIDKQLVDKGQQTFTTKCSACHKLDSKLVGPPLKDVTKRRKPEWIMNMILNPQQMTQENKIANELFATYLVQMAFQDVTQDDARAILEYFRSNDQNPQSMK
jgi:mono/diheme cytochrome c family protein